jgi:hypothetical protein
MWERPPPDRVEISLLPVVKYLDTCGGGGHRCLVGVCECSSSSKACEGSNPVRGLSVAAQYGARVSPWKSAFQW